MLLLFIVCVLFSVIYALGWLWVFHPPFHAQVREALRLCNHKWLDTTVPFSDMKGGWHECQNCHKRKYIKWGFQLQREKELGHIVEDQAQEDKLMAQYAPELYPTQKKDSCACGDKSQPGLHDTYMCMQLDDKDME